jgi:hypothetical protein
MKPIHSLFHVKPKMPRKNQPNIKSKRIVSHKKVNRKRRGNSGIKTVSVGRNLADRVVTTIMVTEGEINEPLFFQDFQIFVANSLYNPLGTGGGAQPAYFNFWMAGFVKYRVLMSSIRVEFNNPNATPVLVCVLPTLYTTQFSDITSAEDQRYAKSTLLSPAGTGKTQKNITTSMNSSKIFGKNCRFDENYAGDFGHSPNFKWYWQVYAETLDGSDITDQFVVKIKFRTEFYGLLPQTQTQPMLQSLFASYKEIVKAYIFEQRAEKELADLKGDDEYQKFKLSYKPKGTIIHEFINHNQEHSLSPILLENELKSEQQ